MPEAVEELDFLVEVAVAVAFSLDDETVEDAASLLEPESSLVPVPEPVAPVAAMR